MNRRNFLKSSATAITSVMLTGCIAGKKQNHPNVLLILSDDQGWGDVHSHDNPNIDTPVQDKLAADGVRFDRFYVSPVCAPTRASLLTGRYHLRTGTIWVTHNKETMRSEEVTIAEILKNNGYATGCFGKWHNGGYYPHDPNGQGFDEFYGFCAGHWNNYFDTHLQHNHEKVTSSGFITDVLTDQAIQFISKNRRGPFFCYIPYNVPHSPFQVPEADFKKYKERGFNDANACVYGMVENMDRNIGRLLNLLDDLALTDNTIVIFMTDNGPNTDRYNGDMRGRKGSVHEGGGRVPLFIKWPAKINGGKTVEKIAAHIDILPTILEFCNIPIPQNLELDGTSLVPLMGDEVENWPDRILFTHNSLQGELLPAPGAARSQTHRLIVNDDNYELYDMINDPSETHNIFNDQPAVARNLVIAYETWFKDVTRDINNRPEAIPVGYDEAKSVKLLAPDAHLVDLEFQGRMGWANDWITGWKSIKGQASWPVQVVNDGDYEITLFYACPEGQTGSVIEVSAGDANVRNTVSHAHDPEPLPSPDRVKRGEVYEKVWGELVMGTLHLSKGMNELVVKAVSIPGEQAMQLKAVEMRKI